MLRNWSSISFISRSFLVFQLLDFVMIFFQLRMKFIGFSNENCHQRIDFKLMISLNISSFSGNFLNSWNYFWAFKLFWTCEYYFQRNLSELELVYSVQYTSQTIRHEYSSFDIKDWSLKEVYPEKSRTFLNSHKLFKQSSIRTKNNETEIQRKCK